MRATMKELKAVIESGDTALIRKISLQKQKNGNATEVALYAQKCLWEMADMPFSNDTFFYKEEGRKREVRTYLSDEF